MIKEALIIVDVQNDFCTGGALEVPKAEKVIKPLNEMIKLAKDFGWPIVATRDWHPEKTRHFEWWGGKWPVHCVQNTEGAKFHYGLLWQYAQVFSKGMGETEDSYSGFDAKGDEGFFVIKGELLENFLKRQFVNKVYLGGLATDYCVKVTALDAVRKGFETCLLEDAIAAVNLKRGDGKRAIEEMKEAGVKLIKSDLVIREVCEYV